MNVSEVFIRRPVMTILLMAALLCAGLFGYVSLPVSELPNVDFPTIVVNASLPGADADTMASAIATPLEAQFSKISGLDTMNSQSSLGSARVTLQFRLDRNIDAAATDVQAAISGATRLLPQTMPAPPSFFKVNPIRSDDHPDHPQLTDPVAAGGRRICGDHRCALDLDHRWRLEYRVLR